MDEKVGQRWQQTAGIKMIIVPLPIDCAAAVLFLQQRLAVKDLAALRRLG